MTIQHSCRVLLAMGLFVAATPGFSAQRADEPKLNPQQIEQVVHDYILAHPEVVLESVHAFDQRAKAAAKERIRETVKSNLGELYSNSPVAEAAADKTSDPVTLVEFFDYRCGYCKKVEDMMAGLAQRPGVRIVYKDLPILGPDSVLAAQAALAAEKQGGYQKFHHALLTAPGPLNQESVEKIAGQMGLDIPRLKKDMASAEVKTALTRNSELASKLGVQSTPTFVVGQELVAGAPTPEAFEALLDAARPTAAPVKPQHVGGGL